MREWVGKELGAIAKPDEIRFADNLPKTRSGKIMRRLLRALARGEEICQDVSTLENPAILDQLRGVEPAAPSLQRSPSQSRQEGRPRKKPRTARRARAGRETKSAVRNAAHERRAARPAPKQGKARKLREARGRGAGAAKARRAKKRGRKCPRATLTTRIITIHAQTNLRSIRAVVTVREFMRLSGAVSFARHAAP